MAILSPHAVNSMFSFLFKSWSKSPAADRGLVAPRGNSLDSVLSSLGFIREDKGLTYRIEGPVDNNQSLEVLVELWQDFKSIRNLYFILKNSENEQEINFSFTEIKPQLNDNFVRWINLMSSSQASRAELLHESWRRLDAIVFGEELLSCIPNIEALRWRWGPNSQEEVSKRESDQKVILRKLVCAHVLTPEQIVELVGICKPTPEVAGHVMSVINYGVEIVDIPTKAAWLNSFASLVPQSVLYKSICSIHGHINAAFCSLFEEVAAVKITNEYLLKRFESESSSRNRMDVPKSKSNKVPDLCKIFDLFTSGGQRVAATICISEGFKRGSLKGILSSVQENHKILALMESVRDVPQKIAYVAEELNLALTMIQVFKDLNQNDYALHLIRKERKNDLLKYGLPRMEGLNYEVFKSFLNDNDTMLSQVLSNLQSFDLTKEQQREMVLSLHASNRLVLIIAALDTIPEKLLQSFEREFYLASYKSELGICSGEIYTRYKELSAPELLTEKRAFISTIKSGLKLLMQSGAVDLKPIEESPYCEALIGAVYPTNGQSAAVVNWNPRYSKAGLKLTDCSKHIGLFVHKSPYRINTTEGVDMILRPNRMSNQGAINDITLPIDEAHKKAVSLNYKHDELLKAFHAKASALHITSKADVSEEELLLQAYSSYLSARLPRKALVELLALYEFITEPNLGNYFLETTDRASKAKNQEYAHLLELREYFSDRIRDTQNQLLIAWHSYGFEIDGIKEIYSEILRKREFNRRHHIKSRLQADHLGMTPTFNQQISNVIKTTEDLEVAQSVINKMKLAMQKRISVFMQEYAAVVVNPESIELEKFDLSRFETEHPISIPKLDDAGYLDLFEREFREVFNSEVELIDSELAKYTVDSTKKLKSVQIQASFMKNQASWYARRTAGVCVFNCTKQWDLENYFQLVFFDPIKLRCEGLILLHHYQDSKGKILTASFNPTSTLLYKVDELAFFDATMKILIEFAIANDFDFICCSTHKGIRTNRTGGEFERALSAQLAKHKKKIMLDKEAAFSFTPKYIQQELEVLWKRD